MARQIAEMRQGNGNGDGARGPAVGGVKAELSFDGGRYFGRGEHGAQAAVAAGDGLGQAQHIGFEIEVPAGEELSGPAESRGDFVGDEESAVAGAELTPAADELVIGDEGAQIADDRLHDEGGNVALLQQCLDLAEGLAIERRLY